MGALDGRRSCRAGTFRASESTAWECGRREDPRVGFSLQLAVSGQDQDEWRLSSGACLECPQTIDIIDDRLRRQLPLDRTKTPGALQAVPVWNVQAILYIFYEHSEPTMIERDQDEWRLASGSGLDRSKLSIHRINRLNKGILSLQNRVQQSAKFGRLLTTFWATSGSGRALPRKLDAHELSRRDDGLK